MNSFKKFNKFVASFVVLMFLMSFISIYTEELKIGFVDFEKTFSKYKKTGVANQKLQRIKEEKEKAAQALIDEINKLKAEAEILSAEAKIAAEKDIRNKLRSLRDFTDDAKKELLDERNVAFKKITDEIREIIAAVGAKENFSLILDDKALFYKKSAFDLTEQILSVINDDEKVKALKQK